MRPESDLAKKAWRQGINHSAVVGRTHYPSGKEPAFTFQADGSRWITPAWPSWALRDDDCPVIAKGIETYGERPSGCTINSTLLISESAPSLGPYPHLEEVLERRTADGGQVFLAVEFGDLTYTVAPVAYTLRRYGAENVLWRQAKNGLLSAWVEGRCVALITPSVTCMDA